MKKLMLLLLSIKIIVIGSTADGTRYIIGTVNQIDWFNNSCTFKIKEESSPSRVPSYRLCKILEQAHMSNQDVVMEIKERSDTYYYAVNFMGRNGAWGARTAFGSFTYQLFGTVEDIYYHSPDDKCYIAMDTGFPSVLNNKNFHLTKVWNVCAKAINAFYSREKVIMMAIADVYTVHANEIVDLQLAKC